MHHVHTFSHTQVSVAVLLDNFIGASTQMELEERLRLTELKAREQQMRNPLESLLMKLAKEFSDSEDLSERLQKLYQVCCRTSKWLRG
jgi:ribosomal protein L16 Arg81 hydroxylase